MVIDEADISGSKYVNALVGDVEQPETTYLLHCKILNALPNQQTVIHAVDDAIRTLQTDRVDFVLLLTDAAGCMTAAGRVVKQTYPRLFHITSVDLGLHRRRRRHRRRLKGIHYRSDTNRTGAEGLSFYYPRLLHCLGQMLAVMSLSQHRFVIRNRQISCSMWYPMYRARC